MTTSRHPPCLFCGDPERVELFEVWTDHTFMLETCCEGRYETLVQGMENDPVPTMSLLSTLSTASSATTR